MRFVKFCLVGASGAILQMGLTYAFTEWVKLHYIVSLGISIAIVTVWNYAINSRWTFKK